MRLQRPTYPVDQVKDESHSHAKLFKVQLSIIVHVCKIPNPFQLVVSKVRVLEHGGCLRTVEMRSAIAERAEDLPVFFDFVLFDAIRRHVGR